MDNNLDLFANKLANALNQKGYSTSINYSNTDFGQSTYIYVRKSENEIDYNDYLKIRISDHSVENLDRMRDEYHILFNYTLNEELAIENAINSVNYYFYRDKYFDKQDIVVQQKAYNVQTDSPSETDVITKQWVTKKTGKTIYEVTRTYNIPATKWINKETGNVFRTIIKNNLEYGGKISDNPSSWEMPSKSIYNYAKKIKENYPKVWDLGGNIRGNQSFKDLEKVIKRGYWLQSERDFYVKWQSFIARHQHDFRIAGVIANLKWLVYPNIGEEAVKEIIEESIKKKYSDKMNYGGEIEGTMQSFLNNLSKKGTLQKHPIERNSLIYNNEATLNFSNFTTDNPNEIYLQEIIVFDRDKGTGSKIMRDIIDSADETGAILTLYAIPLNMGIGEKFLNKAQLIKFYEKFGFIADYKNAFGGEFESAQDLKDYVLSEETEGLDMIRFPKKNNGGVINNNDYSAIDEILHKLKPYQDELTEKWIIGVNEKGEIELTEWDIEMYRFSLTVDLVKAVGNYISDGDVIKEIKLSKDQGSIIISCMVIRDNKEYNFSTEVILAGGYNIQRLHLRYIVKTNLPNKKSNPLYDKLNEKYKGMNKVQKLREQISLSEKNIKSYQNKFETALENSKLTDFEVEKLSRQQKPESWETLDIPWQEIVNRGADKNFNYDENLFNKSQEDYKKSLIKSWRTFNANFIRYGDIIKRERKEIEKLNKKIQDLGYEKMKKGGEISLAPNGKQSNLTPEQYKLVRTPAFKKWFGDWENSPETASKVIDENGEPLVVYHGTDTKFNVFNKSFIGSNFKLDKIGFFFTSSYDSANMSRPSYPQKSKYKWTDEDKNNSKSGFVISSFLNIRIPLRINEVNNIIYNSGVSAINTFDHNRDLISESILRLDKDGFILKKEGEYLIVAINPNQIKLADGTNTTFDANNPNIRFEAGGPIYTQLDNKKNTPTMQDLIPGGLSKGMTLSDIAKKHSVSLSELKKEFEKGIKTEMEHTTSKNIASEIATDHLFEDPKYYTKLSEMENKNALCPVGTEIQSIIFERKKMSLTEARKWVKKHKYSDAKLDKTDNYYRFRQQMPSKFEKGSIRTITLTDGIKGIIGCPLNKMAKGGSVEDHTAQILKIVSKYGWSVQKNLNRYQVYNKKGVNNFDIIIKGDKYTFEDSAGTKLMSGSGQLEKSIDKLATEYFYAKAEEPQTEKEAAIKQASEIVEIAMNNGISVQKLSFNEYSDAIFKATNTSYGLPYLSLAYDVQTNIEAKNNDLIVYTSAPENYDGFGTKTIELTDYFDTRGKQVRKVNVPIKNKDWQTNRYASGNFGFYNEKDFNELVTLSGSPFKKQTLGQSSKGVIMEYLDWEENLYSILEELGDMSRGDAQGLVMAAEMNGLNLREKYSLGISEKEIAESILGENNIPQNIIDAAEIINAVGPSASDAGTEDRKLYSEALKTIRESEYKMEMGELKKKDKFSLKTEYANPYELNRAIESFLDNNGIENLTSEQKAFIKRYSGYGGLEKYGATGSGLLYEYYTPDAVIQKMWGLAFDFGFVAGKSILEPSCGTGEFIKYAPSQSPVIGYEINKYSALIAKALYPNAVIKLENFEKIFMKNNSSIKDKVSGLTKYDLIIGNPPYGDFTGKYAGMGEKDYTKATNYIEYFILRGLDLLNEGGLLVFIVGAEKRNGGRLFLESGATEAKKKIAEKSELLKAYRLPAGVFDRTGVVSEIVVIKKI